MCLGFLGVGGGGLFFVVVDTNFLQFGLNCLQTRIGSFAQNCYVALDEKYGFKGDI